MAILEYVPKNVPIKDNRTPEGGYYVAQCDVCGRKFYPKRDKAKYCSQLCAQRAYRKRLLEGQVTKKSNGNNSYKTEGLPMLKATADQVASFFALYKLKGYVKSVIKEFEIGDEYAPYNQDDTNITQKQLEILKNYYVKRISSRFFNLTD